LNEDHIRLSAMGFPPRTGTGSKGARYAKRSAPANASSAGGAAAGAIHRKHIHSVTCYHSIA